MYFVQQNNQAINMAIQFPPPIGSWALMPYDCLSQIGRRLDPHENAQLTMTCKHFYQGRPAIEAELRMDRRSEMRDLFSFIDKYFPQLTGGFKQWIEFEISKQTLESVELTETMIKVHLLELLKYLNKELLKLMMYENDNGLESLSVILKTSFTKTLLLGTMST